MIKYLINSFKRKLARRVTKKYSTRVDNYNIEGYGVVQFANWENPLVAPKEISLNSVAFFRKFLKEGDFAIDIGANIGHMTIPMALAAGKQGMAMAFDPNPFVYEILLENSKLNPDLTNIHTFNYAISEQEEEFYYLSSEASFNNGGISKERDNRHGKYSLDTKIKGIRLEEFILKSYSDWISKIKLIKIDTEGYDKEIIKSISGLLNKYKPAVITECFGKTNAEERYEHFDLLKSKGYSLYYISDFDVNAKIVPIEKKEDMLLWKHFDLFALVE
jgi:FkbM family methyltransferase